VWFWYTSGIKATDGVIGMASRRGKGEGSIYQRADGLWVTAIDLGRGPDGKRRRKVVYGKTRAEVRDKLKAMTVQQTLGVNLKPERVTVAEFISRWLESVKATKEPRTYVDYEQVCRVHIVPALGHIELAKLEPQEIQRFYQSRLAMGRAPRTVRHHHEVLRNALGTAVEWRLIQYNPAEAAKAPPATPSEKRSFLTNEQAKQLLEVIRKERLESLIVVALMTGSRSGELRGLRWQDVDWERRTITIRQTVWIRTKKQAQADDGNIIKFKPYPKNRRPRLIPLPARVMALLKTWKARQAEERVAASDWTDYGLVWTRPNGLPLRAEYPLEQLHKALKAAGLPKVRVHDLRHTAASLLIAMGVPLKEVSETLGHASIEITADLYGHLEPDAQRATMEKLERNLFGKRSLG